MNCFHVEHLPNEILGIIFEKLLSRGEKQSFLRCRAVCVRWKDLIDERILKNRHISEMVWFNVCKYLPRNATLEFLNLGPSRFRGSEIERRTTIESINNRNGPSLDRLNKIRKVDVKLEDGSTFNGNSLYRRLFLHLFTLHSGINAAPRKIQIDANKPGPVTSMKISGQMIVTGHSTGCLCTWTLSGRKLDYTDFPAIKCIKSLSLIDAYKSGPYIRRSLEGDTLSIDHHTVAALSSYGILYLFNLIVPPTKPDEEPYSAHKNAKHKSLPVKCLTANFDAWKIKYVTNYGDVIAGIFEMDVWNETHSKVFIFRLDTSSKHRFRPDKLPEVLTVNTMHFKKGFQPKFSGAYFSLWHLPGSYAWEWQCITIVHHTGTVYRCFMPNHRVERHRPVWKRYAPIEQQDLSRYSNMTLRLINKGLPHKASLHLIKPLQVPIECINEWLVTEGLSFATMPDGRPRTILIGQVVYVVLHDEATYKILGTPDPSMVYLNKLIESCLIYQDGVFILLTKNSNELLISIDGLFYRHYSPSKSTSFAETSISAIHYTSNVLFLGSSDGRLRAYYVNGRAKILNLNLDTPNWIEEGKSFVTAIKHITTGMLNAEDGKIIISTLHEDNSITIIKRSLGFME